MSLRAMLVGRWRALSSTGAVIALIFGRSHPLPRAKPSAKSGIRWVVVVKHIDTALAINSGAAKTKLIYHILVMMFWSDQRLANAPSAMTSIVKTPPSFTGGDTEAPEPVEVCPNAFELQVPAKPLRVSLDG